jgi:hypothetical protein
MNQGVTEDKDEWGDVWTHVPALATTYRDLIRSGLASYTADIIEQPSETIVDGGFTHPKYGVGAGNFFGKPRAWERRKDRRHMNAEYGRLICEGISTRLNGCLAPAAQPAELDGPAVSRFAAPGQGLDLAQDDRRQVLHPAQ